MSAAFSVDMADLASDADAAWFKARPDRSTRIRPFIEGELPYSLPQGDGVAVTIVRQMQPGARMRLPVYLPKMPADTEAEAMAAARRALGVEA